MNLEGNGFLFHESDLALNKFTNYVQRKSKLAGLILYRFGFFLTMAA